MASDAGLYTEYLTGLNYAELAKQHGLNVDSVRSRVSRARRAALEQEVVQLRARVIQLEDPLRGVDLGEPLHLSGDFIIVGDVHCNTVRGDFFQRPLQIATRHLAAPRQLIIAGDLLNADAWSDYEPRFSTPSWSAEVGAARYFLDSYLKVFDRVYILMGNHDLRPAKRTHYALTPELIMRMVSSDERITVSAWGHCIVGSPSGEWRVTHGSEYSVNQLVVAAQLADKFHQHIIGHHQHHLAVGWSRFGHYVLIDNGGLFDQRQMAYVQLDDNKRPTMKNGFTMLRGGIPYVFGDTPFTDWDFWLNEVRIQESAA